MLVFREILRPHLNEWPDKTNALYEREKRHQYSRPIELSRNALGKAHPNLINII